MAILSKGVFVKKLGIFVVMLVLALGLAFMSCDDGSTSGGGNGTFTLTDIPAEFNGKYAYFQSVISSISPGYPRV
jgi:hypothetical protein